MTKKLCKFAVLRYVPDEYREEYINIGLLFHNVTEAGIKIRTTNNFKRVTAFDDEVDLDFLKLILESVEEQFTFSTVGGPSYKMLENKDFLNENTRHFVNQLQFSKIRKIYSLDTEKDFEDLFRTYVYFETKKKKRITHGQVKQLMKRVFEEKGVYDFLDKSPVMYTDYEEPVHLDYGYTTEDDRKYLLKAFSLDYDKMNNASNYAKTWVYNIERLQSKKTNDVLHTDNIEFKFVINNIDRTNKKDKLIYDILSEVSEPILLSDLDDFIDDKKIKKDKLVHKNNRLV